MNLQKGGRGADAGTSGKRKRTKLREGRKQAQLRHALLWYVAANVFKSKGYRCSRHEGTERSVVFIVQAEMLQMIGTQIYLNGQGFPGSGRSYPVAFSRTAWVVGFVRVRNNRMRKKQQAGRPEQ